MGSAAARKRQKPPEASSPTLGPAFEAIERRPIADLAPYAGNARLHDEQQLADLERSIREYGWTIPVLVDERDGIVAGHARVIVAERMGMTTVPVLVARGWSDAKKRAYILADNKLTERGGWNWEMVAAELKDLASLEVDLALTGFEQFEIEPLLNAEWRADEPLKDDEARPHGATDEKTITVTTEQYEVIRRAIERERDRANAPKMSEGKALERIASQFSTSNEVEK